MSVSVTMPRLGESVSEGTVTRWLKKEGEHVDADEPLLEVSTDKVDTEIPSPTAGVISSIKVSEDETVEVGAELAVIDEGGSAGGEAGDSAPANQEEGQEEPAETPEQPSAGAAAPAAESAGEAEEAADEPATAPAAERAEIAKEPDAEDDSPSAPAAESRTTEQPAPAEKSAPAEQPAASEQPAADGGGSDGGGSGGGGAAYVTPLVRKLAAERGIDLSSISGTGVGGRIRKSDVLEAKPGGNGRQPQAPAASSSDTAVSSDTAAGEGREETRESTPAKGTSAPKAQPTAPQADRAASLTHVRGKTEKLSRLRQVIAKRMTESLQISAQLTTVIEVDITKVARLRDEAKRDFEQREGVKLSFLPFFAVATCEALKAHPAVNSSIDLAEGTVTYHDAVHLGIAVDTERGLLVPVIQNAQDLNLGGLARKIADLAGRTRNNAVAPDELGGGTFTLTNTGSRGALFDTPIINQPQVGILGTGSVVKRPVVVADRELGEVVAVRSMVYLAMTYDHRIVDGADAARFLNTVKDRLEDGSFETELGR